jgi:hypothetical protein
MKRNCFYNNYTVGHNVRANDISRNTIDFDRSFPTSDQEDVASRDVITRNRMVYLFPTQKIPCPNHLQNPWVMLTVLTVGILSPTSLMTKPP